METITIVAEFYEISKESAAMLVELGFEIDAEYRVNLPIKTTSLFGVTTRYSVDITNRLIPLIQFCERAESGASTMPLC